MGSSKCVLPFETKAEVKEALATGSDLLKNNFIDVRKWLELECCQSRQVWIECFTLPPHGWSSDNFNTIGEL